MAQRANVIPLPVGYTRDAQAELLLREVRMEVYNYHPVELAQRVGVSRSTIESFRSGRTKWPRHATLFALLDAMGYKLVLMKR